MEGLGAYFWPNGAVYFGFFERDLRAKWGKFISPIGVSYEGCWKND